MSEEVVVNNPLADLVMVRRGKTATVSMVVDEAATAKALGSGDLDVLATPMMIAVMERAANKCLAECLPPGMTSVGIAVDIEHVAASALGENIVGFATIKDVNGRRVRFDVAARDNIGEIGHGTHTREIVDPSPFMHQARGRRLLAALSAPRPS